MYIYPCRDNTSGLITILFFLCVISSSLAQGPNSDIAKREAGSKELAVLQKQARLYRSQGLELQRLGNLEGALSFYQKAIELDPVYAVVYNDLGIIYEAKGFLEYAEENYLKAIELDPNYLSSYSNLALLYENKSDLQKAALYWQKRKELGSPDELWTQKAENRLRDLMEVVPELKQSFIEQETINLNKQIAQKKRIKKLEESKEVERRVGLAKKLYNEGSYKNALDELSLALSLDPHAEEALVMMDMAKSKLREQEKKANIDNIQAHFQEGLRYYQQDDLPAAKREFDKITGLTISPQKN